MLDHAVISRHLRSLETWTGTVLLQRGRTGVVLTAEGECYHAAVAEAIDRLASATLDLMKGAEEGQLRIWCMPGFASKWLLPRIAAFEAANGSISLDVRPSDVLPDFNRHEADIDLRYAPVYGKPLRLPPNVRSVALADPPVIAVASPAFLAAYPAIRTSADLLHSSLLHEEDFEHWRAWFVAHGVAPPDQLTGMRLWHAHLTVDAACQGRGVALANRFLAVDEIAAGRLVEIGGADGPFPPVSLGTYLFVARTDRWSNPAVAQFRRWLIEAIASG